MNRMKREVTKAQERELINLDKTNAELREETGLWQTKHVLSCGCDRFTRQNQLHQQIPQTCVTLLLSPQIQKEKMLRGWTLACS